MSDSTRKFHRVSVTQEDGSEVKYDARVEIQTDHKTGKVVFRIFSRALPDTCSVVRSTGNQAADMELVEKKCLDMYWFDKRYGVRPAPKPSWTNQHGRQQSPGEQPLEPVFEQCGTCGGAKQWETHEGNWVPCPDCREV